MTEFAEQLTPGQTAIKEFADAVLRHCAIRYKIPNNARPAEVVSRLQGLPVDGLLLTRGDAESHPYPQEYSEHQDLYIGKQTLVNAVGKVGLGISRWDRVEEVGEVCERQIDLSVGYTNGSQEALQTFSVFMSSKESGSNPRISRGVNMTPNSYEDGSGEYQRADFPVSDETIVSFVAICRAVFARADLRKLAA